MPGAALVVWVLVAVFLVLTVWLFRVAFGVGDRRRERDELRRAAERASANPPRP